MNPIDKTAFFTSLQTRFQKHNLRHPGITWEKAKRLLEDHPEWLSVALRMEATGGEPDLVVIDGSPCLIDMVPESPVPRRGLCYDEDARLSRKKFPPPSSAETMAKEIGVSLLDEATYHFLQKLEPLDTRTSSWLATPSEIRKQGGSLFGDRRYGRAFVFHNGADSYYADRGFRGMLLLQE